MKHLNVLEQAELIHVRREGRLRWNVLNPERLRDLPDDYLERWQTEGSDGDDDDAVGGLDSIISSLSYKVTLPVSPGRVYRAFLEDINVWWPDRKLNGSTLILEPFVGGRFYEALDNGAGVLHGFLSRLEPSREIWLIGPMDIGEAAAMSLVGIQLDEINGRTQLRLTHRTFGEVNESSLRPNATEWADRLDNHLRAFVSESSSPAPPETAGN
jgi:uncharacterized protein YndB with AHSA1/START domain